MVQIRAVRRIGRKYLSLRRRRFLLAQLVLEVVKVDNELFVYSYYNRSLPLQEATSKGWNLWSGVVYGSTALTWSRYHFIAALVNSVGSMP